MKETPENTNIPTKTITAIVKEKAIAVTKAVVHLVKRYDRLLITALLLVLITRFEETFHVVGPLMYIPALLMVAATTVLLLRNVFNWQTTDDHVDKGEYVEVWNKLEPKERFILTYIQWVVYFLGACIVAAGMG